MKRFLGLVCLAAVLTACGGDDTSEDSRPETLPIRVDGTDDTKQASFVSFFPRSVAARPGDKLEFEVDGVGEPHTVAFGTLVDDGLAALDTVAPKTVKDAFLLEPTELYKVPSVFGPPPTYQPENQAAGQACFLDSGEPPVADPCPTREQPDFTGTQSFYNSGLLPEGSAFSMTLSDDIEPGTYRFMCVIHRGAMTGAITVVGEEADRPGPAAVGDQGRTELARALENIAPALGRATTATPATAVAGVGSGREPSEFAMTFGPAEASITAGQSVSWSVYLCHTITFNPPPEAFRDLLRQPDGSVRLNALAYAPSKAPPPPELSFDPAAPPVAFDAGAWDGTGFFNSGGMCSLSERDLVYKLTFAQPGTYQLRCLFHPLMQATVKVA